MSVLFSLGEVVIKKKEREEYVRMTTPDTDIHMCILPTNHKTKSKLVNQSSD